jgi:glycosyltransferase involved in cell wall biosynthesis
LIRPPLELLCQRRLERLDSPVLIHVANINPQKNHRLAIHAFARLLTDFPNARLVICGASDHHPDLADAVAEQIATLRLDGKVILAGPTDRRRLARLLSEAHIGILPSSFEGFSIVSLEYAYFGLPTLLSMTGAAEEFLGRYGHGLIARSPAIPPQHLSHANVDARCRTDDEGSIEEVRQHMSALLGDYGNWMRKAASVAARCDEYSIDVTAERYRQVIDRCG